MKARCICDGTYPLTIGKIYEVEDFEYNEEIFSVINDGGQRSSVFKSRFNVIEEEKQVNKEYRITITENGHVTSVYATDNPNKAIEYIENQNKNYEVFKYLQDNLICAKLEVEENGTKIKVTIGDYVLTN